MIASIIPKAGLLFSWLPLDILIHFTVFLLVCYSCLKTRREAAAALLWIFMAWSFPVIGPLLYLFFGINRVPRKAWRKHKTDLKLRSERLAREYPTLPMFCWRTARESLAGQLEFEDSKYLNAAFNRILPETPLLAGNRITPLVDGDQTYPAMLAAIRAAQDHVHLQTFIVGNDAIGRQFLDLLAEKAKAGVQVRFLFERFGSTAAVLGGLFQAYRRIPNMKIQGWTQANLLKRQFQINLRNHRKIMVIDGKTAFIGGINLRRDNIARPAAPAIRDYHFMLQGPVVQEMQYSFLRDWYFMSDEDPEVLLQAGHFPPQSAAGNTLARLANSGPTPDEMEAIAKVFFECLTWARQELLIVTPYFVPSADILQALKSAARRGVAVRLLVPQTNNHIYAGLAGRALYEELLEAGIRIYERKSPFMHAKAMIADNQVALVGSANLDIRSLRLNYESNIIAFDRAFVRQLRGIICADFALSREIEPAAWRRRPLRRRLLENFCHLLAPAL